MRRIVATLAVVALMFSVGSAWADDTSEANELFVEAVKQVKSVENVEGLEEKAAVLEEALGKLNEIVDDHPSSGLAVKLISGQNIGAISLEGVGEVVKRARKEAEREREFEETLKAAEQGDAKAQFSLGIMYDFGRGVPKNEAEAVKWYRLAAEQGHAEAQHSLGYMYDYGAGVPEDKDEAIKWFRRAAEQGHDGAKMWLNELEAK